MSSLLYRGLIVLLSVALSLSLATWVRGRQEVQAVTVANESLRKTLGELTVAIAEKDKELDRMARSACDTGQQSRVGSGSVPRRADRF
jgi:hypothetical protein